MTGLDMIRAIVLSLLIANLGAGAVACSATSNDDLASNGFDGEAGEPPESPNPNPDNAQCVVASDCDLAASTCCECPSFAVPAGQNFDEGCEDVYCQPSSVCPAVETRCAQGQCVMICSAIITSQICAFGFQRDVAGCLMNECATSNPANSSCTEDSECVQIPADCCGCSQGGKDVAVAANKADADIDSLDCPANPACPGIDVCDPDQASRCIAGSCVLAAEPDPLRSDHAFCGTPDFASCAQGTLCVLNGLSFTEAGDLGVGVCQPE